MTARLSIPVMVLLALASSLTLAQPAPTPQPTTPAAPKQPSAIPKQAPRPVQKAAPVTPPQPLRKDTPAPAAAAAAAGKPIPLVYTPWVKLCSKDANDANGKDICLTMRELRLETGRLLASVILTERAGEEKKALRVTLPLGMQLTPGTRMIVDSDAPVKGEFAFCLATGCMADFEVGADLVARLKKGQQLQLQTINMQGQVTNYPLPLAEFAKANEGPPTDPLAFEAEQKRQWEERIRNLAKQPN